MPAAKRAKAFKLPENITKICAIFFGQKDLFSVRSCIAAL